MLKGTTKIELTDVKTGEKEVYENHNMVTNALKDIFKPLGLSNKRAGILLTSHHIIRHCLEEFYALTLR